MVRAFRCFCVGRTGAASSCTGLARTCASCLAAQAWNWIYFLEKACRQQVLALSAGRGGVLLAPEAAQAEAREQSAGMPFVAGLTWPGLPTTAIGTWCGVGW